MFTKKRSFRNILISFEIVKKEDSRYAVASPGMIRFCGIIIAMIIA